MSNDNKKSQSPLLEVRDLKQYFPIKTGMFKSKPLKAVDGVSFSINPGETLGLVGESGCGKTTVGRSILRLYTPTGGDVFFNGERVDEKSIGHMRKEMQMVFQDPYSSLNPRMTVEDIIGEPLDVHKLYASRKDRRDRPIPDRAWRAAAPCDPPAWRSPSRPFWKGSPSSDIYSACAQGAGATTPR